MADLTTKQLRQRYNIAPDSLAEFSTRSRQLIMLASTGCCVIPAEPSPIDVIRFFGQCERHQGGRTLDKRWLSGYLRPIVDTSKVLDVENSCGHTENGGFTVCYRKKGHTGRHMKAHLPQELFTTSKKCGKPLKTEGLTCSRKVGHDGQCRRSVSGTPRSGRPRCLKPLRCGLPCMRPIGHNSACASGKSWHEHREHAYNNPGLRNGETGRDTGLGPSSDQTPETGITEHHSTHEEQALQC